MEVDYVKLGRRVRHYREKAGLSQIQLAEKANVSRPYVSQIENGVFNTSLETIISVANALQISIEDLLVDSLEITKEARRSDVNNILVGCSPEEERILTKNMKDLRETIRPYNIK